MRTIALASILLLAVLCACSGEPTQHAFPLLVVVHNEADAGVPGAQITIGTRAIGKTAADGTLTHLVPGTEGQRLTLRVTCPEETTSGGPGERAVELRFLKKIDEKDGPFAPLRARFRCERVNRSHVVVVRTNLKESFPIQLLGEPVGQTGTNGAHQFVVNGGQGEEIEVRIDTSSDPKVRPASPSRTFRIPAISQLLVFDQTFEKNEDAVPVKSRRRRGPRRL